MWFSVVVNLVDGMTSNHYLFTCRLEYMLLFIVFRNNLCCKTGRQYEEYFRAKKNGETYGYRHMHACMLVE